MNVKTISTSTFERPASGVFRNRNGFTLCGLPMPLSSNQAYARDWKGKGKGFYSTAKLKAYKQSVESWGIQFSGPLREAQGMLQKLTATNDFVFEIDRLFFFNAKRIICKDGRPKRLDVTNRIKHFDDALSKLLGIDDKFYWFGSEKKIPVSDDANEFSIVSINVIKIPQVNDFFKYLNMLP